MKYHAFLSYSQKEDGRFAPALENELQRFAKPWFKQRAVNIFRDSSDLSATPNLWGKIEQGLSQSEYLLYMASPGSAASKWCRKEVGYWKDNKPIDNFLLLLTEGELVWDDSVNDFDWEKSTALPEEACRRMFPAEPLYVDFRGEKQQGTFDMSNPAFRDHVVMLAATLHGRAVGDMVGEEVRQHKKTMRIRNAAIAVLTLLLIAAAGLGVWSEINRQEAVKQTGIAKAETMRATDARIESDRQSVAALTSTSKILLDSGNELEALLAAVKAGKKLKEVPELAERNRAWYEAVLALQNAVYDGREINRLKIEKFWGVDVSFSPDGESLVMVDKGRGGVGQWSNQGREMGSFDTEHRGVSDYCSAIEDFVFSPDGGTLVTVGTDGAVRFWGTDHKPLRDGFQLEASGGGDCSSISGVHVNFNKEEMILVDNAGAVSWWGFNGKKTREFQAAPVPWLQSGSAFSPQGWRLATYSDNAILLWDLAKGEVLGRFDAPRTDYIYFDRKGDSLWAVTKEGTVRRFALDGKSLATFNAMNAGLEEGGEDPLVSSVSFSSDGEFLAVGDSNGTLGVWTVTGERVASINNTHPGQWVGSASFSADGSRIVTSSSESSELSIRIWQVEREAVPALQPSERQIPVSDVSGDGNVIAKVTGDFHSILEIRDRDGRELIKPFHTGQLPSADFPKAIIGVAVSPDGKLVATGGADGTVKVWDLNGKPAIRPINAHREDAAPRFSPDGQLLVTVGDPGSGGVIKLWNMDGSRLASLSPGIAVNDARFSSDGGKLIASGAEGTRVWSFDLDDLLRRGARKLRGYVANHPDTADDRSLCDEIDKLLAEGPVGLDSGAGGVLPFRL